MDGVGDQFLARPAFADDQNIGVGFGDAVNYLVNILHRLAGADDVEIRSLVGQNFAEFFDFGSLIFVFEGFINENEKLLELDRLFNVVKSPGFGGFDSLSVEP